jgi:hypothetical protein
MTQDEIIEMARQSDLGFLLGDSWLMHDEIERFAKLVAQHEREACAKVCDEFLPLGNKCAYAIRARDKQDGECKYCTDGCPACDARKLSEQEPVAWIWEKEDGYTSIETHSLDDEDMKNVGVKSMKPLYAKPQFIGLSEDEIVLISADCAATHQHTDIHFARAIEAKLKDRNSS